MTTFTERDNIGFRTVFIHECRQKAWGARCHADWIGKQLETIMAQYQQLSDQHRDTLAEIDTLKAALDSHTVDNRQKRKDLQAKADTLAKQMQLIAKSANEGQQAMAQLHASAEQNLALAAHAEGWEWKEAKPADPLPNPEDDGPEAAENKA